jgi:hypothetical protein
MQGAGAEEANAKIGKILQDPPYSGAAWLDASIMIATRFDSRDVAAKLAINDLVLPR